MDVSERKSEEETEPEGVDNNVDYEEDADEVEVDEKSCSLCKYCCPVCGECMYESGDSR